MTEQHALRRQLALRDLVLAQILCVVGSSWVGVAAGLGRGQAVMWVLAMLLFYLPVAASVIALNRVMPLEGGLYVWARHAFGDLGGFLAAWNIWAYGLAVIATILDAIPTELSYLIGPAARGLPENHAASLAIVGLVLAALVVSTMRGLQLGKWIHNAGGVAILVVFGALILLPVWRMMTGSPVEWRPLPIALPPVNLHSMALFGQMLVGALSGLEYIAILAGESQDPERSIGRSVWIASPVICAMFILGTSSVVAFVHGGKIDFIAPIPQTLRLALGNSGVGSVIAMTAIFLLQVRLLGATSYIFTGVTRLPMTAGWDHLVPEWFARLHPKWGTPVNSISCTGLLALTLVLLANLGVHAQEAFQLLANASSTHYEVAYLAMFAIPLVGKVALRRELPGWLAWTSAVGFCAAAFSLLISAYPFVDVLNPASYAVKILGTVSISNFVGILFYLWRVRTYKHRLP